MASCQNRIWLWMPAGGMGWGVTPSWAAGWPDPVQPAPRPVRAGDGYREPAGEAVTGQPGGGSSRRTSTDTEGRGQPWPWDGQQPLGWLPIKAPETVPLLVPGLNWLTQQLTCFPFVSQPNTCGSLSACFWTLVQSLRRSPGQWGP